MTAREFAEWQAYGRLEPWDEARADLRTAQIAAILATVYSDKGKQYAPADFMPDFDKAAEPADPQTAAQQQVIAGLVTKVAESRRKPRA